MAAGDEGLRLPIELAQKLTLPAVPRAGADGADVGDRQQKQQFQPLRALYDRREVADRLGVSKIAAERDVAHFEMMLDEPCDRVRLGSGQPEPRAEPPGNAGADLRMVLDPALADVVQEGCDVERTPVLYGADDLGRQG